MADPFGIPDDVNRMPFGAGSPAEEGARTGGVGTFLSSLGSGVLKGLFDTAAGPGRLAQSNPYPDGSEGWHWYEDQRDKGMKDWSTSTAMNLAGVNAPFAPVGAAGIFGGRLAKTADQAALRTAEEMHAGGADRGAILDKTGWFQGSDGKWRFEIPDEKAQMNPNVYGAGIPTGRWGKIGEEVWHKDLYDAYPDLRGATGMIESRAPGSAAGGSYSAPGVARSGEETIHVQAPTVDEARSVGLHELQHAVQEREGFASGGNPSMFTQGDDALIARGALSYRREIAGLDPHLTPKQKDEIVRQRYRALGAEDWIPPQAARDWAHDVEGNPEETLRKIMELYGTDKRTAPYSPRELYKQVPGEIEARNVQARRDMTPEERRARPPWETADMEGNPVLNQMFGKRVGMLEGGAGSRVSLSADSKSYPVAPRDEWYGDANYQSTGGRMVEMTPDEFLSRSRPMKIDDVARENINDLKQHMESGRKLDPLAIYKNGKEDGRHRAHAAKELGINKVPVLVWD